MRNIQRLLVALLVTTLAACGGGGTLDSGDGGAGGGTTPVFSLSVALSDADGQLAQATPLTVTATLTATNNGVVSGRRIVFTLDDTSLASFSNDAGTAITNADGVATITLLAGSSSGSGVVTASYNEASAEVAFASAGDGGDRIDVTIGTVVLLADKLQLGTGSNDKVVLSALVRDANNNLISDVPVTFSSMGDNGSDGGELVVLAQQTEADGVAKAELKSSIDASVRDISVIATVGQQSSQVTVNVVGTQIDVSAPESAVIGSTVQISAILRNSENQPIANKQLSVSSELNNTLSNPTPTTNSTGQATFSYTATNSGLDVLTISALGTQSVSEINVSEDEFFLDLEKGSEVALNSNEAIVLTWNVNGEPQANGTAVRFDISRGGLSVNADDVVVGPSTLVAPLDDGKITVYARSSSAGVASIIATQVLSEEEEENGERPLSTQSSLEFIAEVPETVSVQASPTQLGINEQSSVRAVVRDANGNPVKNATVSFSLSGDPGGDISPASAKTNSQGIASTVYTATATTSRDGVVVSASVGGKAGSTTLTVGERSVFFRIATGNTLQIPDESNYKKQFSVIVTDSSGNPVQNQDVYIAVTPTLGNYPVTSATWAYRKGEWVAFPGEANFEYYVAGESVKCANEDFDLDGRLDDGEDYNNDGLITPGNVVTAPQKVTSDNNGVALFELTYGQSYARWIQVDITVSDRAEGTENRTVQRYVTEVSSTHVGTKGSPPPPNPFGSSANCEDTL